MSDIDWILVHPDSDGKVTHPSTKKRHLCPNCGAGYTTLSSLNRHLSGNCPSVGYICPYCSKQYHRPKLYERHLRIHPNVFDVQLDPRVDLVLPPGPEERAQSSSEPSTKQDGPKSSHLTFHTFQTTIVSTFHTVPKNLIWHAHSIKR